jgi:hypothetical protein
MFFYVHFMYVLQNLGSTVEYKSLHVTVRSVRFIDVWK